MRAIEQPRKGPATACWLTCARIGKTVKLHQHIVADARNATIYGCRAESLHLFGAQSTSFSELLQGVSYPQFRSPQSVAHAVLAEGRRGSQATPPTAAIQPRSDICQVHFVKISRSRKTAPHSPRCVALTTSHATCPSRSKAPKIAGQSRWRPPETNTAATQRRARP